jgi:hypothetical protein
MLFLAGLLCADISDDIGVAEQPLESDTDMAPLFRPWINFTDEGADEGVASIFTSAMNMSAITRELSSADEPIQASTCLELEVYPIVSNTMVMAYFLHAGYSYGLFSVDLYLGSLLQPLYWGSLTPILTQYA